MRFKDIQRYLRPYSMVANRTTTINHAFAASVAPNDSYDPERVRAAILALGQDPDADLLCVYCAHPAETWDHVHATVKDKVFSGHGHRIGNLLPCCKPCNSKKGNKDWKTFLATLNISEPERLKRQEVIGTYLDRYGAKDSVPEHLPEYQELQALLRKVLELLARGDELAGVIRKKIATEMGA